MAVTLDPDIVLDETGALMAYTQRAGEFRRGQGGTDTGTFTANTTPTLERAVKVTRRHAGIVQADFPQASDGRLDELVTIAALRAAIELEASTPQIDVARIKEWRDSLDYYVSKFGDGDSANPEPPGGELRASWNFGPREPCHTPGSELPYPVKSGSEERFLWW